MNNESPTDELDIDNVRRAAIDRSVKGPVLFLFTNAAFWLMAATVMGFFASIKLISPTFIDCEWLTFGRIQPAHMHALVYGWGIQAALGVSLWLMARRTQNELKSGQSTLITLGVIWNIAVTMSVISILGGGSRSIEWLEFPKGICAVFGIVFLVFGYKILAMAAKPTRVTGFTITNMYLIGAILWFTWLFMTSNQLVSNHDLGALGAGISAWYVHGTILLFFVPVGVGSAYYFIPKITGQPIHSAQLANIGFWVLAAFAGWTGMQRYAGGPIPAWMTAVSSAAGVLLLISVGIVGLNQHLTTLGNHKLVATSPTLRFTYVGAMFYPVSGLLLAMLSWSPTADTLQFTHAWYGYQITAVYGFFSMTVFGAIYYIVPRLAGCEWLSVRLIRNHFWFSVYAIGTIVVTSVVAGISQGSTMNNPEYWNHGFINVVTSGNVYMAARALAWAFILWSNSWFLIHLLLMVAGLGRRSSAPTLLSHGDSHTPAIPVQAAKA